MIKKSVNILLSLTIFSLFILSSSAPAFDTFTNKIKAIQSDESISYNCFNKNFDIYDLPEYVAKDIFLNSIFYQKNGFSNKKDAQKYSNSNYQKILKKDMKSGIESLKDSICSPWPMHGHDKLHTGKSPYKTEDNFGSILWKSETQGWAASSPAIDDTDTIYIGSWYFYAVSQNGTLKWSYNILHDSEGGVIESCCPVINNNVIYIGTQSGDSNFLYAFHSNGTINWKYYEGGMNNIVASPVIGDNDIIYYTSGGGYPPMGYITALYTNGTLNWRYETGHVIYSSPAIGLDGTIYCGSHDGNVYALNPNNGTLKWKYDTGSWVHGSPTIGDDGTVYIGSDNGYLYAFYPNNGTIKWNINIGAIYGSLALDDDGTIYTGVWEKTFYAINPNGTIKWSFDTGDGKVWGSSPALSADDTLYFGTCDLEWEGGIELIALYTNGTVKWRKELDTVFSSPAIGKDGTVYIGSTLGLYAFSKEPIKADANGPYYGLIDEPVQFSGNAYNGVEPYTWHWNFGDGNESDIQNPMHMYITADIYDVTLTVIDFEGNSSNDTTTATIAEEYTPISLDISKPQPGIYLMDQKVLPFITPIILGRITIEVEASQIEFGIDRVELFIDGTFKANLTDAPYSWTWSDRVFLRHTITVIAYDNSGQNVSKVSTVWKFF